MTDGNIEQEEEYVNPNVTVSYNVGPGHELYDASGADDFAWQEFRERRNQQLKRLDKYQGILFYNTLTETQQSELTNYRQDLLDATDYDTIEEALENWPSRPDWML